MRARAWFPLTVVALGTAFLVGRGTVAADEPEPKAEKLVKVVRVREEIDPGNLNGFGLQLKEVPSISVVHLYFPDRAVVCSLGTLVSFGNRAVQNDRGTVMAHFAPHFDEELASARRRGKADEINVPETFAVNVAALAELERLKSTMTRDLAERARELKLFP